MLADAAMCCAACLINTCSLCLSWDGAELVFGFIADLLTDELLYADNVAADLVAPTTDPNFPTGKTCHLLRQPTDPLLCMHMVTKRYVSSCLMPC